MSGVFLRVMSDVIHRGMEMDYYKMMLEKNPQKEALIVDGAVYTYGMLIQRAQQLGKEWGRGGNAFRNGQEGNTGVRCPQVRVIKEKDILAQLVSFLACYVIDNIPLIVPYDGKEFRNGECLSDIEIPENACMAVSTSGTTGIPKIYFRTYESWAGYFPVQNEIFQVRQDSRLFMQGSLAFTGNLNLYMAQFYAGATVIAENAFLPKRWAGRMQEWGADGIYLIPSKLMLLPEVINREIPSINMIISGSQSLGKREADRLKRVFPNTHIILYYAASELNYVTYVSDGEMTEERNLIGRPFPQVEVFLQDDEIYVNTPYHVEGVACPYSLSDCGYQDKEGNFYFAGRKDDILNIRGRKVSAVKIENILGQVPEIQEAAVLAEAADGGREQYLVAYIVFCKGKKCRQEDIYERLRRFLAHYEMPRRLYFVEGLPRNESGKVDKKRLAVL